jgi:hypothetical protein
VTKVNARLASQIVWLDSLFINVDRTSRNTNMLWWHKELWLIDHGAALYFHHAWQDWEQPKRPFPRIKDHVLLPLATELDHVDAAFRSILNEERINAIVSLIPDEWLTESPFKSTEEHRKAYAQFLLSRIADSEFFVKEAQYARESLI